MAGGILESIFWVEVDRIHPNPFQPRKVFDEDALKSLAESIRSYGVLQPLTVTRKEIEKPGEGIAVEYELIAGERRLRASKIAGVREVPVVIRSQEDSDRVKLELAIIENLQREDLNPVDRALAFQRLAQDFGLKHIDIGKRVGKSREYVSNTLRILMLPKEMQNALAQGEISEGHTRPLLMLMDKPDEQRTLFTEIITKKLTVRDAEQLGRRAALEKVRKTDLTPELLLLERELTDSLGTRVRIERKQDGGGGKVLIDFFSVDDLSQIRIMLAKAREGGAIPAPISTQTFEEAGVPITEDSAVPANEPAEMTTTTEAEAENGVETETISSQEEAAPSQDSDDLYSISGFTV